MNGTHLHLLLNHFPIVGTLIASVILLWGIIKQQNNLKIVACYILLIMAIVGVPVYISGEPAEDSIKNLSGISHSLIEEHEDAATFAIWLMSFTGVSALLALILNWRNQVYTSRIFLMTFFVSFVCFIAMARTGYLGGQIRHPETNSNFQAPSPKNADSNN